MSDDAELAAMGAMYEALKPLDSEARRRVQAWVGSRYSDEGMTATLKTTAEHLHLLADGMRVALSWCPACKGKRTVQAEGGAAKCVTCEPLLLAISRVAPEPTDATKETP